MCYSRGCWDHERHDPETRYADEWNGYKSFGRVVARCATCYTHSVIKSFKHKGLKRYYESGNASGIQASHRKRLRLQLAALDTAMVIEDMDIPEYRLHPLKGKRKGIWAIDVSGNWRLTFRFQDSNAFVLNYEDYH